MARKLVLTDGAVRDLNKIRTRSQLIGNCEKTKESEIEMLLDKCEWIAAFPGNPGREVDWVDLPDLFEFPCGKFRIFFIHLDLILKIVLIRSQNEEFDFIEDSFFE